MSEENEVQQQDAFESEFEITEQGEIEKDYQDEPQEAAPGETQEEAPEEAQEETTEEAPPAKVEFTPEQQEVFNQQIAKKVFKQREAEREAEELRQKLADAQRQLNPEPERPEVPPMPDPYDPDYNQKVQDRDKTIQERAAYDAQAAVKSEILRAQQQVTLQQQEKAAQEKISTYMERGKELGHDQEDVVGSTQYLMQVGLDQQSQAFIRDHENGPDMAVYLAKNPQALEDLLGLQQAAPHMAFAKLATDIKEAASGSVRPQKKLPPDPPTHLSGKGAPERREGPPGATFE